MFELPENLGALSVEELNGFLEQIRSEAAELLQNASGDAGTVERLTYLADAQDAVTQELDERESAEQRLDDLRERFDTADQAAAGGQGATGGDQPESGEPAAVSPEPALVASGRGTTPVENVIRNQPQRLNVPLSEIQARQPEQQAPARRSVLVASSDIPGFTLGGQIETVDRLVSAIQARARAAAITSMGRGAPRIPVAQLQRSYRHTLDMNATPDDIERVLQDMTNPEVLIAAGGWCAPSEISYDFYNIICEDGLVDLPTAGVNRGGIRWPTSPSYADVTSVPWTWTETMDVAAATGTGQSGTKPCVRVPCADFNEARLACDGICITAGNLTTDAWPEQLRNYIRLVNGAQAHYTNSRVIASMVAQSSVTVTVGASGSGVASPVLSGIELQASDYREKYRMCEDAVLEAVFPRWIMGPIRADLSRRTGIDLLNVTDAMIRTWFDTRRVRAQFVTDWQNTVIGGSSAPTAWPTSVQFLLYAPGTFVRGNGLTLDLGIVRDSTLNETNDYTASWMEECYLVGLIGHESRVVTVPICTDGTTGAADLTACM